LSYTGAQTASPKSFVECCCPGDGHPVAGRHSEEGMTTEPVIIKSTEVCAKLGVSRESFIPIMERHGINVIELGPRTRGILCEDFMRLMACARRAPEAERKPSKPDGGIVLVTEAEGALFDYLRGMPPFLRDQTRLLLHECAAPNGLRPNPQFIEVLERALIHD
jgi:hypothetical protein